ncbi:uncharacterized protein PV09_03019 [Verruconis gallopava]|uniref:Ubiquitin 3 binding protein But2 C-terminal domain-containing protein n=1 Tax=Verruconis gallopava TaxID=253628 RepID=A0A0D2AFR1_9PEZI|nr:uncharacterized protein PV09_03019 [Verruconis gallopava]KIW05813.1 hypothetical protein PV09_03019 [Verruconis gallopava]
MSGHQIFEHIADELDAAVEYDGETKLESSPSFDSGENSETTKNSEDLLAGGKDAHEPDVKATSSEDRAANGGQTEVSDIENPVANLTFQPIRRSEASTQCRCAEGDRKCIAKCVAAKVEEVVVCQDCRDKWSCEEAKKCKPVKPKPCDICDKDKEDEQTCKKTCYLRTIPCEKCSPKDRVCQKSCVPQHEETVPCWKCPKNDWVCLKHCFISEDSDHQPFCCDHCHKDNDACLKKCQKNCKPRIPKPQSCWDCKKDDIHCHKHCWIPDRPQHNPFCCHDCHKENKVCHEKCDKNCKPPASSPRPSCGCKKDDLECLKRCEYPEERRHDKPKCCHECPKEPSHQCHKTCDKKCNPMPGDTGNQEKCVRQCNKDDWDCKKACKIAWKSDRPSKTPRPSKPNCHNWCGEYDKECQERCWEKSHPHAPDHHGKDAPPCEECHSKDLKCHEHCQLRHKHGNPQHNQESGLRPHWSHPWPPQNSHVPPPSWGSPQHSEGKVPGQLFGACPANFEGEHQFPTSVIPISTAELNKAYGNQDAYIDDKVSSVFNFELPVSFAGKTCSLFFFWPQGRTDICTFSGQGLASFDLVGRADAATTCASRPQVYRHLNDIPMKPGTTYWIADHPCTPGPVSFEISGKQGFALTFAQHQPIGLYIRAC